KVTTRSHAEARGKNCALRAHRSGLAARRLGASGPRRELLRRRHRNGPPAARADELIQAFAGSGKPHQRGVRRKRVVGAAERMEYGALMAFPRIAEKNKKPGVCYAVTTDGVELPIVDVTHSAFTVAVTDAEQRALLEQFLRGTTPLAT